MLGRIPFQIFARKASIKNWERIKPGRVNPLLKTCYENAVGVGCSGGSFHLLSGYLIPYHSNKPSTYFPKSVLM